MLDREIQRVRHLLRRPGQVDAVPAAWGKSCFVAVMVWVSSMLGGHVALAEDWPQWRGPAGSGVTTEQGVVTEWSREQNVAWRVELPAAGNSTPIVWQDKIFVTLPDAAGKSRLLRCYRRTDGEMLWEQGVEHAAEESTHETNPYCSASPVTDGKHVVVWHGSAGLFCYDLTGKELWRRDLGPQTHMWGYGTSPIIYRDLCVLNFGPGDHERLIAVRLADGETAWQVEPLTNEVELQLSSVENDGNASDAESDKPRRERLRGSWGTPIVVSSGSRDLLVVGHPRRLTAYNPLTGQVVWTCGGFAPLAYTSPMSEGDVVLALGGYFGASLAVRTEGTGDVTASHRLWHKPRDASWLGTGVIRDGYAYVCDMNGRVSCLEVSTGESKWEARLTASGDRGATWSSGTLTADGLIYWLNQAGDTFVFRADPAGYQQIARNSLGEPTNASVVIAAGDVIIRTQQSLWCLRPKK